MWKWVLPTLCVLATTAMIVTILDVFGFGARPWLGFWDSVTTPSGTPFVARLGQIEPGGAADRAGIRDGDTVDLRNLNPTDRAGLLWQPVTTRTIVLQLLRRGKSVTVHFVPSTQYQADAAVKIGTNLLWVLACLWALGCAWIIALRRAETREGRYLCLALLAVVAQCLGPENTVWPNGIVSALQYVVWALALGAAALLPVYLASGFGARSRFRLIIEAASVLAAAAVVTVYGCVAMGVYNASIDPLPFAYGAVWQLPTAAMFALAVIAAGLATSGTPRTERSRAGWLLLPLPVALLVATIASQLQPLTTTWGAYMSLGALDNAMTLLGTAAVTFALLRRRVLDVEFVLSRTLVVASVSAIVVGSFALLEWLLGTVLAGVSHATGLVANGLLALVLGLSLNPIHKRVDAFVDGALFRKRYEDERALLEFAKEASFVTDSDALLDIAMAKIRKHTDALDAAMLLEGGGGFAQARSLNDLAMPKVDENDEAILAFKTWHRPVDPHHYGTALHGALAVPMIARGRLLGVLVLGERAGGEAYAPDEVEALAQLAHSLGAALDTLSLRNGSSTAIADAVRAAMEPMLVRLDTILDRLQIDSSQTSAHGG